MSMVLSLRADTDLKIKQLLKDPEAIEDYLYEDESSNDENQIDLDKAWHGIHYMLTGDPWAGAAPYCYLLSEGKEVGDIDVGYGAARALTSAEVNAFNDAIAKIDNADFRKRFNPKAMMSNDIYPSIWDRDPKEDDTLEYLSEYFEELKTFIQRTKDQNKGLIIWMC